MAQAAAPDPLARRASSTTLQRYDDAIRSRRRGPGRSPASAQAASVVLARAYLERYRQASMAGDLDLAARGASHGGRPTGLVRATAWSS